MGKSSKLPLLLALLTGISLLGMQPGAQSTLAAQQEATLEGKDIEWKDFLKSLNRPNEVLELRGEKARHFKNADGSYSALIAPTPIHYRDEEGNWQEIEIELTKSSNGYENVKNGIKSWFPTTSTSMRIGISEEESYTWTPLSLGYTTAEEKYIALWSKKDVSALVAGNEIRYPEIFPGATAQYQVHAGLVKHDLILNSAPVLPEATQTVDFVGQIELGKEMAFTIDGEIQKEAFLTAGNIWVTTLQGEKLFRIGVPIAFEENSSARAGGTYLVTPLGDGLYEMRIQIPADWVVDPKREYPIKIDPTTWTASGVQVDNSCHSDEWWVSSDTFWSSFGNATSNSGYAQGSYGSNYWYDCHVGYDEDWIDETYRSAADWDTTTVPDIAAITNSRLKIYVPNTNYGEFDSNSIYVRARDMAVNYATRSASSHYSDCVNGSIYINSQNLAKGQGYTGWLDLGTAADAKIQSQLASNWFGIGFAANQGGDRGVTLWLHLSTLEVTYNLIPTTPTLIGPAEGVRTTGNSVNFSWNASTDPDGDPITYTLYCSTAASPTTAVYSGSSTSYNWTGAADATTYNWRVRAHDGSSWSNYSATRSFRENGLPAVPTNTTPTNNEWLQPGVQTVTWTGGGADPEADSIEYNWLVGKTNPPLSPYISNGTISATVSNTFATASGDTYYWMVRAYDGYEYTDWSTITSFGVDGVAPTAGTVSDGSGTDIDWQASDTSIEANWSGFGDALSGIASYDWSIGTTSGGTDIQNWTNVGTATNSSASALSLSNATAYYVSVRAIDKAGNIGEVATSDGVTVDTAPPTTVLVQDGTATDIDWQASGSTLSANWSAATDSGSGVDGYEWAIGNTTGGTNIQNWTPVGNVTTATNSGLSLAEETIYVSIRARDKVGNYAIPGISDGVTIDYTGPLAGTVLDGTAADIDFQTSTTTLSANWSGFSDGAGIGIEKYEWAIGMIPGTSSVMDWTEIGNVTAMTNSSLSLTDGTYFISVRAIDKLGNVGMVAFSNGVTVDTVPPTTGTVNDGNSTDIDWQNSTTTISANWTGFTDAGGISHYEWSVGTTPGGTDVSDWSPVGNVLSATLPGLTLVEGTTYYVSVRAFDNSGKESSPAGSDGVTLDTTPPDAPILITPTPGSVTGPSPLLEWSGEGVTFEWDVDGLHNTTPNLYMQPSPLADGLHYWKIRSTDAAGNVSPWSTSWSFVVDATAPTVPFLFSPGNGATLATNPALFTWSIPSDANGIGHYDIEISDTGVIYQASPTLPQATVSLPDGTFSWRVRAVDPYGNTSGWSVTWTFTKNTGIETNPPTEPELQFPIDTLATTDPATLSWLAATDDSGVDHYRIQVGTDAGFSTPLLDATTSTLSITIPSLPTGTYYWRAKAIDIYNNVGSWSETWSFLITNSIVPGVPTLLLPPNGFLLPLGSVWLNWTDVEGADWYEIELMLNGSILTSTLVTESEETTPALPAGTYAWRVRATGVGTVGEWTDWNTFTMANGVIPDLTPPSSPSQYWPSNGTANLVNPEVFLAWSPGTDMQSGVAYHLVEIFDGEGNLVFSQEVPTYGMTTTTPLPNGAYTWRVTAVNGAGLSTQSTNDWNFTIDTTLDTTAPGAVALLHPQEGSIIGPGTNNFEWTEAQDNGMIVSYEVQIDTDTDFATPLAWTLQWADTTLPISLEMGSYAWRVRAIDSNGNIGPWSLAESFEVTDGMVLHGIMLGGGSVGSGCMGSIGGSPLSPELGLLALILLAAGILSLRRP